MMTSENLPQNTELTDDELIWAVCHRGDERAFEELYSRYHRLVAGIGGRFFYRQEQVEEIIQDSFMKAYTALNDYSRERGASFAGWIARIAVNTCYDALRRLQRRPEKMISELSEDEAVWLNTRLRSEGAGDDIEAATIARDLSRKLLSRLSPEDRLVLTLLDVEGLSMPEIAAAIGWSVPKVKVRAYRARIALRKILRKFL